MDVNEQQIKHKLRIRFGLDDEPTDIQLKSILREIKNLKNQEFNNKQLDEKLSGIVKKYCPTFGSIEYAAEDPSDLVEALVSLLETLGI